MDNILSNKEDYITVLSEIINDESLDKDDVIERLEMLLPEKARKNKCPEISSEELQRGIDTLIESFWQFVKVEDSSIYDAQNLTSTSDVNINLRNLAEVISRTYKRKEYYRYFHNIDKVSELKETALNSFWIIKLKPFTVLSDTSPLRPSVNEKFALNLILSQIQYLLNSKGKDFHMPDKCFIQDTLYSFKYRDLSKEAMMLFVDSVANTYGITIDSWK